jgi:hypothetical protein
MATSEKATILPKQDLGVEDWTPALLSVARQLLVLRSEQVFRDAYGQAQVDRQFSERPDPRWLELQLRAINQMAGLLGLLRAGPGSGVPEPSGGSAPVSDVVLRERVARLLVQESSASSS